MKVNTRARYAFGVFLSILIQHSLAREIFYQARADAWAVARAERASACKPLLARQVELQGGGLIRSVGGWQAVPALRRGREGYAGEERILGSREFVEQVRQEVEGRQAQGKGMQRVLPMERVIERVGQAVGVRAEEFRGSGRRAAVSRARAGVAYLGLE